MLRNPDYICPGGIGGVLWRWRTEHHLISWKLYVAGNDMDSGSLTWDHQDVVTSSCLYCNQVLIKRSTSLDIWGCLLMPVRHRDAAPVLFPSAGQSPVLSSSVCLPHVSTDSILLLRIYTGQAAAPTVATRGSRTGWCWRGCCSLTPAGIKLWATARASTCWLRSSWRLQREVRATRLRYEHPVM